MQKEQINAEAILNATRGIYKQALMVNNHQVNFNKQKDYIS